MSGMRCDFCGGMLVYQEAIIATFFENGELLASEVIEGTCDADGAAGKYHAQCYSAAAEHDPSLPATPR